MRKRMGGRLYLQDTSSTYTGGVVISGDERSMPLSLFTEGSCSLLSTDSKSSDRRAKGITILRGKSEKKVPKQSHHATPTQTALSHIRASPSDNLPPFYWSMSALRSRTHPHGNLKRSKQYRAALLSTLQGQLRRRWE